MIIRRWFVASTSMALAVYQVSLLRYFSVHHHHDRYHDPSSSSMGSLHQRGIMAPRARHLASHHASSFATTSSTENTRRNDRAALDEFSPTEAPSAAPNSATGVADEDDRVPTTPSTNEQPASASSSVRVISYSLWGINPRYCRGMVHIAKAIPTIFPGWQIWIYHDNSVHGKTLYILQKMAHVRLLNVQQTQAQQEEDTAIPSFPAWVHRDLNPMTWRFLVASDPTVEAYIIRDSDAMPSHREFAAVQEWLASQRGFHIIRDHPNHNPTHFAPILGGLWGGLHRAVPHMDQLLYEQYVLPTTTTASTSTNTNSTSSSSSSSSLLKLDKHNRKQYGNDQDFLWLHIMPLAYQDCLQHDSYYCRESHAIAFPMAREESPMDNHHPHMFVGNLFAPKGGRAKADPDLTDKDHRQRYQTCLNDRQLLYETWWKQQQQQQQHPHSSTNGGSGGNDEDEPAAAFARAINTTFTGKIQGLSTQAIIAWSQTKHKKKTMSK